LAKNDLDFVVDKPNPTLNKAWNKFYNFIEELQNCYLFFIIFLAVFFFLSLFFLLWTNKLTVLWETFFFLVIFFFFECLKSLLDLSYP
jgi:hypothetical protein